MLKLIQEDNKLNKTKTIMKKTQYRVINRENRKEYILNAQELSKFFKHQLISDYAVSKIPTTKETFLESLGLGLLALALIVCLTNIIIKWL